METDRKHDIGHGNESDQEQLFKAWASFTLSFLYPFFIIKQICNSSSVNSKFRRKIRREGLKRAIQFTQF